jgi:hypothetical protein
MEKRVFVSQDSETWGATINTADGLIMNDTGVAFVRKNGGRWRRVEWFIVPAEIKDRLLARAA